MGVVVTWEGLLVLGRCPVGSDGIDVIFGGLCSAVVSEAKRGSVEKTPAEEVSFVVRSVESSAERNYAVMSLCEVKSAGPGTACSTTGKLVRVTAAVGGDLGQCIRAG